MFKNLSKYYDSLSYHCPSSKEMTERILKQIRLRDPQPVIANIGFGKGNECLLLAQHYPKIIAIEENDRYLEAFEKQIAQEKLSDKIRIVKAPFNMLPFETGYFDLILSEGGISYSDFGSRIGLWKPFLKNGGYLALSELCILKETELPYELADYLCDSYPFREIETVDYKITQIKDTGYKVCGQYKFPDSCWFEYYRDMHNCYEEMPERWKNSKEGYQVMEYIEECQYIYSMYKDYFCYMYFILRKPLN
ncbi:MAG: class I SAM-dependent methyltransferase [Tannerella sp.]|jgi:SAM-dependent methyltransferase|nr:class I SAM-dependent methyltransferase [Tannerella sp.]